ncbi:hypothetical protein GCM10025768_20160 [Microbacterium pseudoresistens]|uniref:Uncharacterized protein n=1 Tax=Microbacterium pseudoresistens TaxID=640634 RepID=A0A7Y9EXD9_9MICO|nr:hypothetical protein [Microbacterium pseudoresistens]NYD55710.1 hypothetical protein [Microbacterium pseudoresistens]
MTAPFILTLPLAAPLAAGTVIDIAADPDEARRLVVTDIATGVRYSVPAAGLPTTERGRVSRARVEACAISAGRAGTARTELTVVPMSVEPVSGGDGAADALSGAERAAADAGAEASWWSGVDRTEKPAPHRFW